MRMMSVLDIPNSILPSFLFSFLSFSVSLSLFLVFFLFSYSLSLCLCVFLFLFLFLSTNHSIAYPYPYPYLYLHLYLYLYPYPYSYPYPYPYPYTYSYPYPHDDTAVLLRNQLLAKNEKPLEYIPLEDLNREIAEVIAKLNEGDQDFDEERLDHLLRCLEINPDYMQQKADEEKQWHQEINEFKIECLEAMKSFISPTIFSDTIDDMRNEYCYSTQLAKRLVLGWC